MRLTWRDIALFVAEMAVYTTVAMAASRVPGGGVVGLLAAVVSVVLMATWWGLLHAPRAPWRLPHVVDLGSRCAWFAVGIGVAWLLLGSH